MSSLKLKLIGALAVFAAYNFYQNAWVSGAFSDKGVEQVIEPSLLSTLAKSSLPKLDTSTMFGVYEGQSSGVTETNSIEELFDIADQEYVGQLGNYQFILYATAEFNGKLSAKVLAKNLDDNTVQVVTVKMSDEVANSRVTDIKLTSITLSAQSNIESSEQDKSNAENKQIITLRLFSRITPPKSTLNENLQE